MDAPALNRFGTIDPSTIRYDFGHVPSDDLFSEASRRPVPDAEERLRADPLCSEYVRVCYGDDHGSDDFRWDQHWRSIPVHLLSRILSFEECVRIQFFSHIRSDLEEFIRQNHFLVWKASNVLWHYGGDVRFNRMADVLRRLRRLSFPGMEVGLGHSSYFNEYGPCVQDRKVYLDGAMGLFVYHRGEHVLMVGFSPGGAGTYVAQVQLRKKRGNRFLYKLGRHCLDACLDALHEAFGDELWLVRGGSATEAIRRSYGKVECRMTPDDEARIRALYDMPLERFVRTGEEAQMQGRTFVRLARV